MDNLDQVLSLKKDLTEAIESRKKGLKRDPLRSFNANSIDLISHLKVEKGKQQQLVVTFDSKFTTSRTLLFVDTQVPPNIKDVEAISYEDLVKLKDEKKAVKRIVSKCLLIIPPDKAGSILKTFGKIFNKYNISPVVNMLKVTPEVIDTLKRKKFFKIFKSNVQCKVCNINEDPTEVLAQIDRIVLEIKKKNFQIAKLFIKGTHSSKVYPLKPSNVQ